MKNPLQITFKFTTRGRPDLFRRGMKSIIDNVSDNVNYSILVSCDNDDQTMQGVYKEYPIPNVYFVYGYSINKIDAINRDLELLDTLPQFDILVNMSDDMVFTKKGFDNDIREAFGDDLSLCVHFPDGYRTDIITMAILGADYFDQFGYIYHPAYKSLWCDNEMTDVAKLNGVYKFVDKQILLHLHPCNDSGVEKDAQYVKTEKFYQEDMATYNLRKSLNFPSKF